MRRRSDFAIALVVVAAAVTAPADASWMRKFPFATGEAVVVQGSVTDAASAPLPDLEVVLEVSDTRLSLRPFGRAPREIHRVATRTDAEGRYALRLVWDERSWSCGY